ncbi:MAG: YebC/PmpR family DNA-binding transcriptional regulator [Planctomycetota bacterium]
MAGHSKWANIKHRKARQDKARGKMWSKCSRAIMAAVRQAGPDPSANLTLRYAIDEARYANMPKDTITRAIEKASGAAEGDSYEDATYEGYGPGGVAFVIDALTDNKTRTVGDVRTAFNKGGGSMGQSGSVSYMFKARGVIVIEADQTTEDQLMELAIEAGADDVETPESEGDTFRVFAEPTEFLAVREAIEKADITVAQAEITKIPDTSVEVRGEDARKILNLIDVLEDNDDVQKVYTNADIPDDVLAELQA